MRTDRRGRRRQVAGQVFRKDGTYVKEAFVSKRTLLAGAASGFVQSPDPRQRFLYMIDRANHRSRAAVRTRSGGCAFRVADQRPTWSCAKKNPFSECRLGRRPQGASMGFSEPHGHGGRQHRGCDLEDPRSISQGGTWNRRSVPLSQLVTFRTGSSHRHWPIRPSQAEKQSDLHVTTADHLLVTSRQPRRSAATTRGGVMGCSRSRTPVASKNAFAIAAAAAAMTSSPTPVDG